MPDLFSQPEGPLSVSQLTLRIKELLETAFFSVTVSGEVSNVSRPQSGHLYFTLKDQGAQIRAVMWRSAAERLRFALEDGLEAVCRGEIDVYPPRGSYQLVVRQIEPRGAGALQAALKRLHARLAAEGLFDAGRKRPLPLFPRRVAFVTSPSGAAIRDFLQVAARRWRLTEILVVPARVQGEEAAGEIVRGIAVANHLTDPPDVIVVGRGGGSLEDLWCFNEESVVRAIAASPIPVVSAVGHEIDVTLSDLAADVRALTPSEAAELVTPAVDQVQGALAGLGQRMSAALRGRLADGKLRLGALAQRRAFRRPLDRLHDLSRRLDDWELDSGRAIERLVDRKRQRLEAAAARLASLSPLSVLARGYSLTLQAEDGAVIRRAAEVEVGRQIVTRLADGRVVSRVEEILMDDGTAGNEGRPARKRRSDLD